jgi:hypothetical protein
VIGATTQLALRVRGMQGNSQRICSKWTAVVQLGLGRRAPTGSESRSATDRLATPRELTSRLKQTLTSWLSNTAAARRVVLNVPSTSTLAMPQVGARDRRQESLPHSFCAAASPIYQLGCRRCLCTSSEARCVATQLTKWVGPRGCRPCRSSVGRQPICRVDSHPQSYTTSGRERGRGDRRSRGQNCSVPPIGQRRGPRSNLGRAERRSRRSSLIEPLPKSLR